MNSLENTSNAIPGNQGAVFAGRATRAGTGKVPGSTRARIGGTVAAFILVRLHRRLHPALASTHGGARRDDRTGHAHASRGVAHAEPARRRSVAAGGGQTLARSADFRAGQRVSQTLAGGYWRARRGGPIAGGNRYARTESTTRAGPRRTCASPRPRWRWPRPPPIAGPTC